jgi:hypothetical protein
MQKSLVRRHEAFSETKTITSKSTTNETTEQPAQKVLPFQG